MNLLANLLITCPPAAAVETINIPECFENFGQIQKILITRLYSGATKNMVTVAAAATVAGWTTQLTAADSTKIVVTPIVHESDLVPGEANDFGSGNQVPGGIPIPLASEPSTFTGVFRLVAQESIKSIKKLRQEQELGVYFVNEAGQIAGSEEVATELHPFPIFGMHVGDKSTGNRDQPDGNPIKFSLKANWSDDFTVVTPTDFNALSELDQTA